MPAFQKTTARSKKITLNSRPTWATQQHSKLKTNMSNLIVFYLVIFWKLNEHDSSLVECLPNIYYAPSISPIIEKRKENPENINVKSANSCNQIF